MPHFARTPVASVSSSGSRTPSMIAAATSAALVLVHMQIACSGAKRAFAQSSITSGRSQRSAGTPSCRGLGSRRIEIAL